MKPITKLLREAGMPRSRYTISADGTEAYVLNAALNEFAGTQVQEDFDRICNEGRMAFVSETSDLSTYRAL